MLTSFMPTSSLSADRRLLTYILLVTSLMASCSHGGCFVNFGRRGCTHRVVHGVAVMCDGQGVESSLPLHLPHDTVYLSLANFNLTRLTKSELDRFSSVQCLAVADSPHLTTVDADAFSGLEALTELTLDGTRVDDVDLAFISHPSFSHVELLAVTRSPSLVRLSDHGATRSLHGLRTLLLRDNAIAEVSPALFVELRRLERLDLTGNRLTSLNWTSLSTVTHLNALLLAGNGLQTVPGSAHAVFFAVKELTLAANPLHCNCQLDWLREFYLRSAVDKMVDDVYCAGPERLAVVTADSDENFECVEPQQPTISWIETEDGRVEVNCTSFGDPAPSLLVTLENNRRLISPPSDDMSIRDSSTPQILVYPGLVVCQATNSHGQSRTVTYVGREPDSSVSLHPGCWWSLVALATVIATRRWN